MSVFTRLLCLALSVGFLPVAYAGWPTDPDKRAAVLGQPATAKIEPGAIELVGERSRRQVLVTASYAGDVVRDVSGLVAFSVEPANLARIDESGFIVPLANGLGKVVAMAGKVRAEAPLNVRDLDKKTPVSFRHEVIAALNVGGCNAGACHGTPSGKNGFKLSLRGFDPAADFAQLTRDVMGRRTVSHDPQASLLLLKGLGRVPHEGGQKFATGGVGTMAVEGWLAEGMRDDAPTLATVKSLKVLPGSRLQVKPARWQQLAIEATFSDGSTRDVTRFSSLSTSDPSVADVTPQGLVEFRQAGEVAILGRYLEEMVTIRLTYLEPKPGFVFPNIPENNEIDKHVFAKLKLLNISPSDLCTDADFVRRAYLDICGIIPSAEEVKVFLADKSSDRRAKLIDALLDRPEYADYWTLKWSDVLRSNRKTIQVKGTQVFQQWIRERVEQNTPFDQVVRDLVTARGSTFTEAPANFYRVARDPQNLAETTAQLFFGVRMQCAKCHNHPFERWTQDDYYSLAAFFARVKQKADPMQPGPNPQTPGAEVIYTDRGGEVTQPRTGKVMPPKFMGGDIAKVADGQDRREALAAWMTSGTNPFFARALANRVWFHVMGRGVVEPVDDFRDSNPSVNDDLLSFLTRDLVSHQFDIKHLIRTIMNSRSYQLSATANDGNKDDTRYFSHAVSRLLTAEQLLDAICQSTEMPEKFAGLPAGTRATQLPDGEVNNLFLKTFGQPARELACECERESDSNLAQALQLINGPTINDKLRSPTNRVGRLMNEKKTDSEILADLYLNTLSRLPSAEDQKIAMAHLAKVKDRRRGFEDLHWALINAKEFLFRH
ncbi:MAG: DUF1549 domain-containing protein [Planctomycetes bacterium]|nr:DUF1549 domain-containing protein [Planctomycetota bacterium]